MTALPLPARRRWWLRPLVTVALYAFIFSYWVNVDSIVRLLRSSRPAYVGLAVALYCGGQLASAYRWQLLLGPVALVGSYTRLAGLYFVGMFFNIFLPTIVGGDAVKAVLLARETGATTRAALSVFMDRNVGLFALLAIATVAAFLSPVGELGGVSLPIATVILFVGYAAINLGLASPRVYHLADRLVARTPFAGMRHRAASLYEAVHPYTRARGMLAGALALSFLHQAAVIGVVFLNGLALGQALPLAPLAVFVPLISLASMLPLSMNGMGVREAAYVLLFAQAGIRQEMAVSLAFLYLAVTFLSSLPGGVVYALQRAPAWTTD